MIGTYGSNFPSLKFSDSVRWAVLHFQNFFRSLYFQTSCFQIVEYTSNHNQMTPFSDAIFSDGKEYFQMSIFFDILFSDGRKFFISFSDIVFHFQITRMTKFQNIRFRIHLTDCDNSERFQIHWRKAEYSQIKIRHNSEKPLA